jgi:hypothetical protein
MTSPPPFVGHDSRISTSVMAIVADRNGESATNAGSTWGQGSD